MNQFGDYLRELRGKMSLREAARLTGISHTYIRNLELGKKSDPSSETLIKLAKAYNIPYGRLASKFFSDITYPKILDEVGEPQKGYSINNDLVALLGNEEVTYKGHLLTEEECKRVKEMLKVLFPDKQVWKEPQRENKED